MYYLPFSTNVFSSCQFLQDNKQRVRRVIYCRVQWLYLSVCPQVFALRNSEYFHFHNVDEAPATLHFQCLLLSDWTMFGGVGWRGDISLCPYIFSALVLVASILSELIYYALNCGSLNAATAGKISCVALAYFSSGYTLTDVFVWFLSRASSVFQDLCGNEMELWLEVRHVCPIHLRGRISEIQRGLPCWV